MKLTVMELAVLMLHGTVARVDAGQVDDTGVRLTLCCLMHVGGDWPP